MAEDGAVLDVVSNGRFTLGVGLGSRPEEFAGYGIGQDGPRHSRR
ncbi:MAG TPA: LLM class flavin-dependent oxidoreductase [Mycobacterium sp.]|nr:LLM class flavin-dependent oxidoreductase [Mycobacterium sp.]